jgi:hypothetical protein
MSNISNPIVDISITGNHRTLLADCVNKVLRGELSTLQVKAIIGFSNQINQSMSAEIRLRQLLLKYGLRPVGFGNLEIGANSKITESDNAATPSTDVPNAAAPNAAAPAKTDKAKKPSVATKINAAKNKKR